MDSSVWPHQQLMDIEKFLAWIKKLGYELSTAKWLVLKCSVTELLILHCAASTGPRSIERGMNGNPAQGSEGAASGVGK